jgi:iron-sulfur cluster assembly protein
MTLLNKQTTNKAAFDQMSVDDIIVTPKAIDRLVSLLTEDKPNLELSVLGGGCSGMSYSFMFTDREPVSTDKIYNLGQFKLYVPFTSFMYLMGTTVDFSDDLLNGGFKFTNPQSERECGCGISFSV